MAHTSNVLLFPLYQKIEESYSSTRAEQLKRLARKYFASSANAELANKSEDELFESLLEAWRFIAVRATSTPLIQFSACEQDGQHSGTRIYLLLDDKPFVIDSVRQCLNRFGARIEGVQN